MAAVAELPAGFADKVLSAQSTFRAIMEAMARPGAIQGISASVGAPAPLMRGAAAIALTLFDHDTPVWLDARMTETDLVARWLRFHTGAPLIVNPLASQFALVGDGNALPDLDRFSFGTNEYPDRSTTLVLQVESLTEGPEYRLTGPGIDGSATLRATVAPKNLFDRLAINAALFPRGIDLVLVHDDAVVAIPRTTRLAGKRG